MNDFTQRLRSAFNDDLTEAGLRAAIIVIAIVLVILALTVQSKWVLAGILAWELLP